MFYANNHACSLRQSHFYLYILITVAYGKRSVRYLCPRLWNKLENKGRQ